MCFLFNHYYPFFKWNIYINRNVRNLYTILCYPNCDSCEKLYGDDIYSLTFGVCHACWIVFFLLDSLGGNAKTIMIANVGPASYNFEETITTLRYVYYLGHIWIIFVSHI